MAGTCPVWMRVLPGQDLAPAGTPASWTSRGRKTAPWLPADKSLMAEPGGPAAIKPRERASSWGRVGSASRLGG